MNRSASGLHRIGIVAVIALAAGSIVGCVGARHPEADVARDASLPERVIVLPLEDRSGSADPQMAQRLTELLVAQLRLVSLSTLGPRDIAAVYEEAGRSMPERFDAATLRWFAEASGCEAVVIGSINDYKAGKAWSDDRLALAVRLVDPSTGKVIRATSFVSDAADIDATVRGIDQLSLYGVQSVTQSLARAR
jgi:hypothetical protein